ncbi:MAG: HNH endonuclease, partial [Candidatus Omnitrophica bacterium]|nr:HNH endonuclease [Candidatus Omnitrophota bacterium]
MLKKRNRGQRKGLDPLLAAGRPDLTLEAIVQQALFQPLFTPEEIQEAVERVGRFQEESARLVGERERLFPDELELGRKYSEGARKQIRVNAYERDPRAREACLRHHGYRCAVCHVLFEEKYGEIGKDFIHVHHLKPIALTDGEYRLDPVEDLRPVCPNCHAMLHRDVTVLSIEELQARLRGPESPCDRGGAGQAESGLGRPSQ